MDESTKKLIVTWSRYLNDSGQELFQPLQPTAAVAETLQDKGSGNHMQPLSNIAGQETLPTLTDIVAMLGDCQRCPLCKTRNNIVFGEGHPQAKLMFIGEGPGADEDATGRPFVGAAGQLLTKMIAAMGYSRNDVYIANIVKCRPPNNRDPEPSEVSQCFPFLEQQISAIAPHIIVTLGKPAARALLGWDGPMSAIRGTWQTYGNIAVMPTYHPAYLLRNPAAKKPAWGDLQQVIHRLQ